VAQVVRARACSWCSGNRVPMTLFTFHALRPLIMAGAVAWMGQANKPAAAESGAPVARASAPMPEQCFTVFANLESNLAQHFSQNPDSQAHGYVECRLCTNGTMSCDANVHGGKTPLIASHIHVATDGDGGSGSGPPVVNFCGSNIDGLINNGTVYLEACAQYMNGSALMTNMTGKVVQSAANAGFTLAERVFDIATNPGKYYFNFRSIASWTHWSLRRRGPTGMCRGQMQRSSPPPTNVCFHLFANLNDNSLPPSNPDSQAYGYVFCLLCTNGTALCNANVYDGKTPLIASHIHVATDGDGAKGSGPPVLNICGNDSAGQTDDGTLYLATCPPYIKGAALLANMTGSFMNPPAPGTPGAGLTLAERVWDIGTDPSKYYVNFHSNASLTHWMPSRRGMCRGMMHLSQFTRRLHATSNSEHHTIHV